MVDLEIRSGPIMQESEENPTFIQRLARIMKNITVEPVAILMLSASLIAGVATQNLALQKACRVNLNLGDEICDNLKFQDSNDSSSYEMQVQQYISFYVTWKSVITSLLPGILLAFVGGWMDMTGRRKILMLLPVIAEIFQNTSSILNVVFFYQLRVEYLIFIDAIFGSIAGGWGVCFLAIFSYIADVTTEVNRTHRLGYVAFCVYTGMAIGLGLSGFVLKKFGYYAVYGTALTLHILNLLYITCSLSDPARTKEQKENDGQGLLHFLKTFFDPAHIMNTLGVVFKKTADNRRLLLCILFVTACVLMGPSHGESAILYMSTRYRFNWDEVQFSVFQTYSFVIHTIVFQLAAMGLQPVADYRLLGILTYLRIEYLTKDVMEITDIAYLLTSFYYCTLYQIVCVMCIIFSAVVFSKKLQWHDSVLGIISVISKISGSFIYCFATTGKIFYFASFVDMWNGISILVTRSIFTKSVAPRELCKVNSLVALIENLMPLLYVPLYTNVYTATMEVLPGAVFLVGTILITPALFVFIWLLHRHRKSLRTEKKVNGTE